MVAPRNSVLDLAQMKLREVNQLLHDTPSGDFLIRNARGAHALACGLDGDLNVTIDGHVGYYCAGMNKRAHVTVNGNAGTGLAENMMSGFVHVKGDASQSAGATRIVVEMGERGDCGTSFASSAPNPLRRIFSSRFIQPRASSVIHPSTLRRMIMAHGW